MLGEKDYMFKKKQQSYILKKQQSYMLDKINQTPC